MKRSRVYVSGTFDLLHQGHIHLFEEARIRYSEVYVSLNTDAFVNRYKGRNPVQTLDERIATIQRLDCVDAVVVNTGDEDSKPAILCVRPDAIYVGGWKREVLMAQMSLTEEFLHQHNILLDIVDYHSNMTSTTELIGRVIAMEKSHV